MSLLLALIDSESTARAVAPDRGLPRGSALVHIEAFV